MMINFNESIVFLNNAGVDLFERRQYPASMQTFLDAIHVYQYECSVERRSEQTFAHQTSSTLSIENDTMVEDTINRASERLSRSSQDNEISLPTNHTALDPIVALDVSNDNYFALLQNFGTSIDKIDFVIRISDNLSSENNRDWKLDYIMSIFNLGVACKRTSEMSFEYGFSIEFQSIFRNQSIQIFQAAHRIVMDGITNNTSCVSTRVICSSQDSLRALVHALTVSMLTTSQISHMMYWDHSTEAGTEYYVMFQNAFLLFHTFIKKYMKHTGSVAKKHAAAA